MIHDVVFHGYRGFQDYRLTGLGRVNLLVGDNGCGKTSLLEGVRFLASGGDPRVLIKVARRRGEVVAAEDEGDGYRSATYPELRHFFYGHRLRESAGFHITGGRNRRHVSVRVLRDESAEQPGLFDEQEVGRPPAEEVREKRTARPVLVIGTRGPAHPLSREPLPLTDEGALVLSRREYRYLFASGTESEARTRVEFIAPDSLEPHSMSQMWNRVVAHGREDEVTKTLRILQPSVRDVIFLSGRPPSSHEAGAEALVALGGQRGRVPLGSLGDGMRRLLTLSLGLVQSREGVLFVDEIDTGLHYSVMGDMWRLVVETAVRSDVQVFATTHSYDCLSGLGWLCQNYPRLAREVSLQRIDSALPESVSPGPERMAFALEKGLEPR